jgi:hypothetical protein
LAKVKRIIHQLRDFGKFFPARSLRAFYVSFTRLLRTIGLA